MLFVRGDQLVSDRAQVEISKKVQEVVRHLCIKDWQSEPHFQHQNAAERRYQDVKRNTNNVLNAIGAPGKTWFHCLEYVCFIMNRMATKSLGWRTPLEKLTGSTLDISMTYRFKFWDEIYFARGESDGWSFLSKSNVEKGWFVGFSESVGNKNSEADHERLDHIMERDALVLDKLERLTVGSRSNYNSTLDLNSNHTVSPEDQILPDSRYHSIVNLKVPGFHELKRRPKVGEGDFD